MRQVVLHLPGLVGSPDAEPIAPRGGPWAELAARSRIVRLQPTHGPGVAEAALVGLHPDRVQVAPGPLAVSALGVDPPDRSVLFCATLLGLEGGVLTRPLEVRSHEIDALWKVLDVLSTPKLTLLRGQLTEHALVWEDGSIELGTTSPDDEVGKPYLSCLPEGDGEAMLRRFIDDSANILLEHDVNRRRTDEGLIPISVLWPWGQGFRTGLPNLALRRGAMLYTLSDSSRTAGLTRMVGYRTLVSKSLEKPLVPDWRTLSVDIAEQTDVLVDLHLFEESRSHGRLDHAQEQLEMLTRTVLEPLLIKPQPVDIRLTICAPQKYEEGLALHFDSRASETSTIPMDERALGEARLPVNTLCECVAHGLGFLAQ